MRAFLLRTKRCRFWLEYMSLVLVEAQGALGAAVVARLVSQGDEVRVVTDDADGGAKWRSLGAHVARGSSVDDDLIERAAQNARSIVVFDRAGNGLGEVAKAVLEGARRAHVGRVLVVCRAASGEVFDAVTSSLLDHVVLITGGDGGARRLLRRNAGASDDLVAEAVDAADDLAGEPRLVIDMTKPEGLAALRL